MPTVADSLQPEMHKNKRSLVLAGSTDNELLAACGDLHGYIIKGSLWVVGSGIAVACVWFLCVAFRAGVLAWPW
ncbi:hypothetical protein [Burkholderia seminalis]|uniref:hypothetical protein n=1 Tax=Burkholderia seminalis TaxID=488731 RepID=UPI0014542C59|nr:hypothetical protein [Burkholderia seminalis]MCA8430072.1 hypothetical protein [Burkholderia seminalis]VWB16664.1 hypothetical protein BSE24067_00604 [Burkholderia seminalis]